MTPSLIAEAEDRAARKALAGYGLPQHAIDGMFSTGVRPWLVVAIVHHFTPGPRPFEWA